MRVDPGDPKSNLERACRRAWQARRLGADLLLYPEVMDCGWTHPSARELAGAVPGGDFHEGLVKIARESGAFVCAGLAERDRGTLCNSAVLIDPGGRRLLTHRKVHELDFARALYATGDRVRVVDTPLGRLGLMICADAFMPGLAVSRALVELGAEVLLSPCAWAVPPGHDPDREPYGALWRDAYEPICRDFGVTIAGASNVGPVVDGPWAGHRCIGCSLVMGPGGRVLARGGYGVEADEILLVRMPCGGGARRVGGAFPAVERFISEPSCCGGMT